jgi:hypothetical protein
MPGVGSDVSLDGQGELPRLRCKLAYRTPLVYLEAS